MKTNIARHPGEGGGSAINPFSGGPESAEKGRERSGMPGLDLGGEKGREGGGGAAFDQVGGQGREQDDVTPLEGIGEEGLTRKGGEQAGEYRCALCGRAFGSPKELDRHEQHCPGPSADETDLGPGAESDTGPGS